MWGGGYPEPGTPNAYYPQPGAQPPPAPGAAPAYYTPGAPYPPPAGGVPYQQPPAAAPYYPGAPPQAAYPGAAPAYPSYTPTLPGGAPAGPPRPVAVPVAAPPPAMAAPGAPLTLAPGGGQRRALLIGINYTRTPRNRLRGCINDTKCIEYLLMTKFRYPKENILMLTDEAPDYSRRATKNNIMQAMRWLLTNVRAGDHLFFQFSGHGSQKRDYSGDEADGYDETILPEDFETAGQIVDDDIFNALVRPLPAGVRLTSLMDCCHSGTGLDLPYTHKIKRGVIQTVAEPNVRRMPGGRAGAGEVILFSGCSDEQTSADTSALAGGVSTGACTFAFIQAIESGRAFTFASLLAQMLANLKNSSQRFTQVPQMSSSWPMDLNTPFYM